MKCVDNLIHFDYFLGDTIAVEKLKTASSSISPILFG